jgi:4-hydroxybenzoate polyprenyltransferase
VNTKIPSHSKSDIVPGSRLLLVLPPLLRPYAVLARLDRPIGIWLLLLPGWWAVMLASGGVFHMNVVDWEIFWLFALGALVMRAAGCVVNDLWDSKLDRQVERTKIRPLASGAVSVKQAGIFLGILLFLGLLILLQMNFITILLGFLSLPLIVLYPLMKRWTWWPQAFLGLTFNFGALMGWSAVTGVVELPALLLYVGGIFWTLGYDTIYAHQDKEDDLLAGVRSTALKFGVKSREYVAMFYALAMLFFLGAGWSATHSIFTVLFLLPAAWHFYHQIKTWNMADPASALLEFKSNRNAGLLIFGAFL